MKCPVHKTKMRGSMTRYGLRYDCPVPECTVTCWQGETSTPADKETRDLRIQCHRLFDALPMGRAQRYKWLADVMAVEPQHAHIGMFCKHQCKALIERLKDIENKDFGE